MCVHDPGRAATGGSGGDGGAATPKEVAAQTNVIITMLPSSPHVREVYLGASGLLASVKPDSLLIDCSTVGPSTARDVAAATLAKKALAADAPVSGGARSAPVPAVRQDAAGQQLTVLANAGAAYGPRPPRSL